MTTKLPALRTETLSAAGHALRGSISTMIVLARVLLEESGTQVPEYQTLSDILSSGYQALDLADVLFELAAGQLGVERQFREPVDLVWTIQKSVSAHREAADRKELRINLWVAKTPRPMMLDNPKMADAFEKLLSYWVESAIPDSTIEIRVTASACLARITVKHVSDVCAEEAGANLSTARVIIEGYGGRLEIQRKSGCSLEWLMVFPLKSAGGRKLPNY